MCTAATYKTKDFYFGRTLDYEFSYGDEVAVLPRNYALTFRHMGTLKAHYAIIGMAYVVGDYPLYYDGINEKGLGMAGLNFVGNAVYQEVGEGRENIAHNAGKGRFRRKWNKNFAVVILRLFGGFCNGIIPISV